MRPKDDIDQPSTIESERIHGQEDDARRRSVEGTHRSDRHDEEIEHERRGRDAPAPGDSEPIEGEGDRGLDGFK